MSTSDRTERLFGAGHPGALFNGDMALVPWPRLPKRRDDPRTQGVRRLLRQPVRLAEVDPRLLVATQPRLVAHHFRYYLEDAVGYPRFAITSADGDSELNRFPVVEPDGEDRFIIWSGHHRSAAALVAGDLLKCRMVDGSTSGGGVGDSVIVITPNLWFVPSAPPADSSTMVPSATTSGGEPTGSGTVTVGSVEDAARVLTGWGCPPARLRVLLARLERDLRRLGELAPLGDPVPLDDPVPLGVPDRSMGGAHGRP